MPLSSEKEAILMQKAKAMTLEKALRAQEIAKTLHMTAPRDSTYKNSKGQNRSATLAAPDTGNLLNVMQRQPISIDDGYRVGINYAFLEYGPLKRLILDLTREQLGREANET